MASKDTGIDHVAKTEEGEFWAVQCKCYAEDRRIDRAEVDSFLEASSLTFENDTGETTGFACHLWIFTTNNWGAEAEQVIQNQRPPVLRLGLGDIGALFG